MPDQLRVRNLSPYGDVEVPALGVVVQFRHEVVVDADIAESLIASGNFVPVHRASDDPPADPEPADQPAAAAAPESAPADPAAPASAPAAQPEEQNQ